MAQEFSVLGLILDLLIPILYHRFNMSATNNEEISEILHMMVKETTKIIEGLRKEQTDPSALHAEFIARYIGFLCYRALAAPAQDSVGKDAISNEEAFLYVSKNFSNCKVLVQESVSAGVSAALRKYSGKEVEYICKLTTVPAGDSKKTC